MHCIENCSIYYEHSTRGTNKRGETCWPSPFHCLINYVNTDQNFYITE